MSKYERFVWERISQEVDPLDGFDLEVLEDLIRDAHTTNPAATADPSCNKCYGRGVTGGYTALFTLDDKGKPHQKPITMENVHSKEIYSKDLSCTCARKFMRTALRLAEAHNIAS